MFEPYIQIFKNNNRNKESESFVKKAKIEYFVEKPFLIPVWQEK